jgi:hypothetical protein
MLLQLLSYENQMVRFEFVLINERTIKDSFPLPRIDDLLDKLREANCITHLDLRSAYNKVRMCDDGSIRLI